MIYESPFWVVDRRRIHATSCDLLRMLFNEGDIGMSHKNHSAHHDRIPWFLWPFWAIWKLITWIIELTGRLVGVILGLVFLIVGILISLTVVGLIVGIPLTILGLLLLVRCIF